MSFTLEDALSSLRVVALPMKTRFRGIEVRETALFEAQKDGGNSHPFWSMTRANHYRG